MSKELFSTLAVALTFIAFYPYIRSIIHGRVRPHLFSWIIWGLTTLIVCFAQFEAGAGVGAWPTAVSALITFYIALLAWFKKSDITITRSDWFFLIAAFASLPLWYVTADPLWAVVLLTVIDTLGFGPTLRKAYHYPHQENALFFFLFVIRNMLVIFALEAYSITTVLFPAVVGVASLLMVGVILLRRRHCSAQYLPVFEILSILAAFVFF